MNRWQIVRQVRALLAAATWADGGLVFPVDSIIVTDRPRERAMKDLRPPVAIIHPGDSGIDPEREEQPGLLQIDVTIGVAVANEQDQLGESALLGANRITGSSGRGLLEVEELLQTTLLQLGPAAGMPIVFRGASAVATGEHPTFGYVATGDFRFRAMGTVARTYQPPTGLAASVAGGTVTLTWTASPRFDARRFILRRAAGTTPPADSTSGTGVVLGGSPDGAGVVTVDDAPGSGTWSYALFLAYDDTGSGTDRAISDGENVPAVVP